MFLDSEIPRRVDCLIVGSGPGGSVLFDKLSQSGDSVFCIEAGGPPQKNSPYELGKNLIENYRLGGAQPIFGPSVFPFGEARCLGGGSHINGALIWRTPDFIKREWRMEKKLPVEESGPLALAPYFDELEEKLNVTRLEYLSEKRDLASKKMLTAAKKMNWKVVAVPRAIRGCQANNLCASGCPANAKVSMLNSFLRTGINNGGRISCRTTLKKIKHNGQIAKSAIVEKFEFGKKQIFEIFFDKIVLSAGATQTPFILDQSKVVHRSKLKGELHLNLKILCLFDEEIAPDRGTICTHQIQQFEEEGMLFMPTNFRTPFFALSLAELNPEDANLFSSKREACALFTGMFRPKGIMKFDNIFGLQKLTWSPHSNDLLLAKKTLKRLSQILFQAGAKKLALPIRNSPICSNIDEVHTTLAKTSWKDLSMVSVHGMAGAKMGSAEATSVINPEGRLWHFENIFVCDSSALPSNLGESPQGTIMAYSAGLAESFLS